MSSEHLVDPELLPALTQMPKGVLSAETLQVARAMRVGALPMIETPNVRVETVLVKGLAGAPDVRVWTYRPRDAAGPLPAFLHMHGGGYVLGASAMDDFENRLLARDLACAIYSVDYRLAPETPHPGPIEDCFAVLQWMYQNAKLLDLDPARIGVKGESAGGGLAAGLAILARDRGAPPLLFQHLIYPMLDDRTCVTQSPHPFAGHYLWTPERNRFGWTALLGKEPGSPDVSPYAAAARVESLVGLPSTFLSVGALDLFLDENIEYARRLSRAGVALELHVYPGAFHGFHQEAHTRVAQAAARDSQAALRKSLSG